MRQVIKHRDIRLLNMIRRTDPEIPLPRCRKGFASVVVQYMSSICPVLVQYLSSELLDMYCTSNAHLLHKILCISLATLWDTGAAIIFMKLFKPRNTFTNESASPILKEIDASSSHDRHRLSVIPYLHIC